MSLIQYAIEMHDIIVHGFCLMRNHIHLLVEPTTSGLSAGIQSFASRYAQYFNRKYKRRGHLFQDRYKGVIVQHGVYFRRLIRYIHRNPVRARMVNHPEEYRWSSHRAYLGLDAFTWVSKDWILALFAPSETEVDGEAPDTLTAFNTYGNADDADAKDQLETIHRSSKLGAFGDLEFVKRFADAEVDELELFIRLADGNPQVGLPDLIRVTCEQFKVSEEQLCGASRDAAVVRARAVLALVATRTKLASLSSLAERLSRDHSSLSRLRSKAQSDSRLTQAADELCNRLVAIATSSA